MKFSFFKNEIDEESHDITEFNFHDIMKKIFPWMIIIGILILAVASYFAVDYCCYLQK